MEKTAAAAAAAANDRVIVIGGNKGLVIRLWNGGIQLVLCVCVRKKILIIIYENVKFEKTLKLNFSIVSTLYCSRLFCNSLH